MTKARPVAKKEKAVTTKKLPARTSPSSAKPIKLGGVPNQGNA